MGGSRLASEWTWGMAGSAERPRWCRSRPANTKTATNAAATPTAAALIQTRRLRERRARRRTASGSRTGAARSGRPVEEVLQVRGHDRSSVTGANVGAESSGAVRAAGARGARWARSVSVPRERRLFTVPSGTPMTWAISSIERSSVNLSTRTARWAAGRAARPLISGPSRSSTAAKERSLAESIESGTGPRVVPVATGDAGRPRACRPGPGWRRRPPVRHERSATSSDTSPPGRPAPGRRPRTSPRTAGTPCGEAPGPGRASTRGNRLRPELDHSRRVAPRRPCPFPIPGRPCRPSGLIVTGGKNVPFPWNPPPTQPESTRSTRTYCRIERWGRANRTAHRCGPRSRVLGSPMGSRWSLLNATVGS